MISLRKTIRGIILEMAVRQDIFDTAKATGKRTALLSEPFDANKLQNIRQSAFGRAFKPSGLWYGYGTEWLEFAKEEPGLLKKFTEPEYFYQLEITTTTIDNPDKNKVLLLDTDEDFRKFKEKYRFTRAGQFIFSDWAAIANDYAGMEVTENLDRSVGWDIRSGCIWNKNAITKIVTLQDPEVDENIPRGAAAIGKGVGWNQNAQTYDEAMESLPELIDGIEEYNDWNSYEDSTRHELEEDTEEIYGDNVWEKIKYIHDFDTGWFDRAEDYNGRNVGTTENLSCLEAAFWLITNWDHAAGQPSYGGSLVYKIRRGSDYSDIKDNIEAYLTDVAKLYDLGINHEIDIDYDDSWTYAVDSEIQAEEGY